MSVWPDIYFNCLIQVGMSPSMTVCLALSPQVFWVQVLFVTVNTSTRTVSSRASFGISSASSTGPPNTVSSCGNIVICSAITVSTCVSTVNTNSTFKLCQ